MKSLADVCQIRPPKTEARRRASDADLVSFVPMEDLGVGRKTFTATKTKPLGEVIGSYTYFADGDVLLAKITPCFENGKLGIAEGLSNGLGFGSSEYVVFRPGNLVEKDWLYYFLSRAAFREEGAKRMSGAVGHKRVSKEFIETHLISLPPRAEQKRIVAILDEAFAGIDTAIANAEKNFANARELFESRSYLMFARGKSIWQKRRLGDISERITKGSSPKWQGISYLKEPGILFVTSENVGEYRMILDDPKYVEAKFNDKDKKSILKNGDVLTNIVGASIGRTAIFDKDNVANVNQAVCVIRCDAKNLYNKFLTYLLNSPSFKELLHDNEVDNARANLSLGFFSDLMIPVPPVEEQKNIVQSLESLRAETEKLRKAYQQRLATLAQLKQAILQKAFAGELTARDPEAMQEAAE